MTPDTMRPPPSKREAARMIGCGRTGDKRRGPAVLERLIRAGKLTLIPWGRGYRVRLEDVLRLQREGWTLDDLRPRRRRAAGRPSRVDPDALRKLDVESLREVKP